MYLQMLFVTGLLFATFTHFGECDQVPVSPYTLSAMREVITDKLDDLVEADFVTTNSSLAVESGRYAICVQELEDRNEACGVCIQDTCQQIAQDRCAQEPKLNLQTIICSVSPDSCLAIEVAKKAVKELKRAVGKVNDAVKKGFKKVGNIVKDGIKAIVNPVKKIVKEIAKPVKKIVNVITKPIRRIARTIGRIIRIPRIIPRIRLPRIRIRLSRGWRRKRQATEPTCDDLQNNPESSCLYYQGSCDSCSSDLPPACGTDLGETTDQLEDLESRLHQLIELYEIKDPAVFSLTSVTFDPTSYQNGGYPGVQVSFQALSQTYTVTISDVIPVTSPPDAGPLIASRIFDKLLPNV